MTEAGQFAQELKSSGQFEIDSSTLALQKSQNDEVKKFAQKMIDDHTAADEKLMETLKQANLPEPEYAMMEEQLDLLNGLKVVERRGLRPQIRPGSNSRSQASDRPCSKPTPSAAIMMR